MVSPNFGRVALEALQLLRKEDVSVDLEKFSSWLYSRSCQPKSGQDMIGNDKLCLGSTSSD